MRLLRRKEVTEKTGLQRSAIYDGMAKGWFPKAIPIIPGGKAVGWLDVEIDELIAERVAARDNGQGR